MDFWRYKVVVTTARQPGEADSLVCSACSTSVGVPVLPVLPVVVAAVLVAVAVIIIVAAVGVVPIRAVAIVAVVCNLARWGSFAEGAHFCLHVGLHLVHSLPHVDDRLVGFIDTDAGFCVR